MRDFLYSEISNLHGIPNIPDDPDLAIEVGKHLCEELRYGDITPRTDLGRPIASVAMLLGWGILAVPTGIVSAEMTAPRCRLISAIDRGRRAHQACPDKQ